MMIQFDECANYRGALQAKSEGGKFFWRVDCDFDEEAWHEIPEYLWIALLRFHAKTAAA